MRKLADGAQHPGDVAGIAGLGDDAGEVVGVGAQPLGHAGGRRAAQVGRGGLVQHQRAQVELALVDMCR
ncbi:MAG: hypothetical protein R2711_15570 [Acidimicrobiales bacterium]